MVQELTRKHRDAHDPSPVILGFDGVAMNYPKNKKEMYGGSNTNTPTPEVKAEIMREGWSRMVKITPIFTRGPP